MFYLKVSDPVFEIRAINNMAPPETAVKSIKFKFHLFSLKLASIYLHHIMSDNYLDSFKFEDQLVKIRPDLLMEYDDQKIRIKISKKFSQNLFEICSHYTPDVFPELIRRIDQNILRHPNQIFEDQCYLRFFLEGIMKKIMFSHYSRSDYTYLNLVKYFFIYSDKEDCLIKYNMKKLVEEDINTVLNFNNINNNNSNSINNNILPSQANIFNYLKFLTAALLKSGISVENSNLINNNNNNIKNNNHKILLTLNRLENIQLQSYIYHMMIPDIIRKLKINLEEMNTFVTHYYKSHHTEPINFRFNNKFYETFKPDIIKHLDTYIAVMKFLIHNISSQDGVFEDESIKFLYFSRVLEYTNYVAEMSLLNAVVACRYLEKYISLLKFANNHKSLAFEKYTIMLIMLRLKFHKTEFLINSFVFVINNFKNTNMNNQFLININDSNSYFFSSLFRKGFATDSTDCPQAEIIFKFGSGFEQEDPNCHSKIIENIETIITNLPRRNIHEVLIYLKLIEDYLKNFILYFRISRNVQLKEKISDMVSKMIGKAKTVQPTDSQLFLNLVTAEINVLFAMIINKLNLDYKEYSKLENYKDYIIFNNFMNVLSNKLTTALTNTTDPNLTTIIGNFTVNCYKEINKYNSLSKNPSDKIKLK